MSKIIGADSSGFISVIAQYKLVGKPDAIVDHYQLPSLTSQSSFVLPEAEGELDVMYELGDEIYAFYVNQIKSNKQFHAYAVKANAPSMKFDLGTIQYSRGSQRGTFGFIPSEDRSKLLVIENPPYEKYRMEEFKLTLYDSSLTKLWDKGIKLPYLDQDFKIVKCKVDQYGSVYLLTAHKNISSKQSDFKGLPLKNYTVLVYNKEQNRLKEFDIKLKDK